MEYEKIIFFRNFLFRALAIGIAFAVFYFVVTFAFWNTWIPWGAHLYKTDEKELGRVLLLFFLTLRVVLVFFFLVPALALHWTAKRTKSVA